MFPGAVLKKIWVPLILMLLGPPLAWGDPSNCFGLNEGCFQKRSAQVSGSTSSRTQINPSAVPIEEGLGLEGIFYKSSVDLTVVRGTGRLGAAISPSNTEGTFFGPPAVEIPESFRDRKEDRNKYENQKYTLAAAAEIFNNKASGLKKFTLRLGLMAKYNKATSNISPGGGVTVTTGPLALYYAANDDQTLLDSTRYYGPGVPDELIRYQNQIYGASLFLNSLIFDYSHLSSLKEFAVKPMTVELYTASLTVKKFILTASYRREDSEDPAYDFATRTLKNERIKAEYFGGIQFMATKHIMLGALYNYYLLREYSASLTLFF